MPRSVSRQLYSVPPNSNRVAYPAAEEPTPTDAQIRNLLRGYDTPGTVLPNAVLITNADSKINELTILGNLSLNGEGDTAINTLGKINKIDCGSFGES